MKLKMRANLPNLKVWAIKDREDICVIREDNFTCVTEKSIAVFLISKIVGCGVNEISVNYGEVA